MRTRIVNEDTHPAIRAIGVYHTGCKHEPRRNLRSLAANVYFLIFCDKTHRGDRLQDGVGVSYSTGMCQPAIPAVYRTPALSGHRMVRIKYAGTPLVHEGSSSCAKRFHRHCSTGDRHSHCDRHCDVPVSYRAGYPSARMYLRILKIWVWYVHTRGTRDTGWDHRARPRRICFQIFPRDGMYVGKCSRLLTAAWERNGKVGSHLVDGTGCEHTIFW